jgi:hypothetical protein
MEAPVDLVVEDREHLIQQIIFLELVNQESLIPEEEEITKEVMEDYLEDVEIIESLEGHLGEMEE